MTPSHRSDTSDRSETTAARVEPLPKFSTFTSSITQPEDGEPVAKRARCNEPVEDATRLPTDATPQHKEAPKQDPKPASKPAPAATQEGDDTHRLGGGFITSTPIQGVYVEHLQYSITFA